MSKSKRRFSRFLPGRASQSKPSRYGSHSDLRFETLEDRRLLAVTLADLTAAGINSQAVNYIDTNTYESQILNDPILENVLAGLNSSQTAPADATLITSGAQFSNITAGTPGNPNSYLIQGNITRTSNFDVPSNVNIYVDGSIFYAGTHSPGGGIHSSGSENLGDSAIFSIVGKQNVQLIGIDNAVLHSTNNLSTSSNHADGVWISGGTDNVLVEGFEIHHVWQGVSARGGGLDNIVVQNNYIHDTLHRAILSLQTTNMRVVHNFVQNAGSDTIDFDYDTQHAIAYENVSLGAGRWAGFVEEGTNDSYFIRGMAIMADFLNPNSGWQMGWADNGTQSGPGNITEHNYFIDNVYYQQSGSFNPTNNRGNGNYFSHQPGGDPSLKGPSYFWGNRGFTSNPPIRSTSSTHWFDAEWLDTIPTAGGRNNAVNGVQLLADLDAQYNTSVPVLIVGDFNGDTFVNETDLSQWQRDYGLNGNSDADEDGDSDGFDFLLWQANRDATPPDGETVVVLLDTDYTSAQGYSSGNLSFQQGWLGQNIAQVSTSGTGTVSSTGGPWDRNVIGNGAKGGTGGIPSTAGFNPDDKLRITFDYQFNLSGNVNTQMANVGFRDEGPNAGNGWEATPIAGFQLEFTASGENGGTVKIFPDKDDSANSDALLLDGLDVGINPGSGDLVSDDLQITYEASTDGAGTWIVDSLMIENLDSSMTYVYSGPTQTFTYSATDAFFAQQLAPNGDAGFTGVTDGVRFEFIDPNPLGAATSALAASTDLTEPDSGGSTLAGIAQAWELLEAEDLDEQQTLEETPLLAASLAGTLTSPADSLPALRSSNPAPAEQEGNEEALDQVLTELDEASLLSLL